MLQLTYLTCVWSVWHLTVQVVRLGPLYFSHTVGRSYPWLLTVSAARFKSAVHCGACAGEAGTPFFSCAASEFVELFVGVGASRVRDLFEKVGLSGFTTRGVVRNVGAWECWSFIMSNLFYCTSPSPAFCSASFPSIFGGACGFHGSLVASLCHPLTDLTFTWCLVSAGKGQGTLHRVH